MKVLHRLHIWPLSIKNEGGPWTEKWPVSHTEEITCFVITYDSLQIITGSKDMSLKVWQINGGKLSQVRILPKQIINCVLLDFGLCRCGYRKNFFPGQIWGIL